MDAREYLKSLMEKTGDNPNSLSQKTKVPQPTIFRFLSRTANEPRLKTLEPIARYFGVPVEVFLSDSARAKHLAAERDKASGAGSVFTTSADPAQIAKTVKLLRLAKGLSIDELAVAADIPRGLIEHVEHGDPTSYAEREPIARAFKISLDELSDTPIVSLDAARDMLARADRRAFMPSAPLLVADEQGSHEPQPEYIGRYHATRSLPVVGVAQLGENGYYEQLEYPVGHGDGYILHASKDPEAYVLQVRGDSMKPAIRSGWYVVVEPNGEPTPGEYVVIQLVDGRKMVKELLFRHQRSGDIEVMSVNGETRISLAGSQIQNMQPVAAVIPPSKVLNP
jgi:transcriptional regulator with XRE-family HTH domain